ncbi:MAG: DUF6505 family protein [Hyphomicrobiales bacterium]
MKFLRVIRFDASDDHVYDPAARDGEWAVSGCFSFALLDADALVGKTQQAFANGFLAVPSFGRATFTTMSDIGPGERDRLAEALAHHFVDRYGAPGAAEARRAAEEEMAFVADLCVEKPINTVFTVHRELYEDANIREAFRVVQASGEPQHARIWDIADHGE